MDICPNLNSLINCFNFHRGALSRLPLDLARAFLGRYSAIAGAVRQLVIQIHLSRPDILFQSLVEQSAQLTDCVVLLHLEEVPAEIVVCRQNAVVYIRQKNSY